MANPIDKEISKLKPEWQTFFRVLVADKERIGWKAYQIAYPACKKVITAQASARRLLRNGTMRTLIQQYDEMSLKDVGITAERLSKEKERIAFADPANLLDDEGKYKKLMDVDEGTRAALESVDLDKEGVITKFKFYKKPSTHDQLNKQLGLYEKDNDQKGGKLAELLDRVDGKTRGLPEYEEHDRDD